MFVVDFGCWVVGFDEGGCVFDGGLLLVGMEHD